MNIRNDVFLVKTGLKWTGKNEKWLADRLNVSQADVASALSGNNRSIDRQILRRGYGELQSELDRQCEAARARLAKEVG